ncbi:MAG: hypothetical protein AVDCRST_MAG34-2817, partial [uncultured Nocardioidaceae bacterium]
ARQILGPWPSRRPILRGSGGSARSRSRRRRRRDLHLRGL